MFVLLATTEVGTSTNTEIDCDVFASLNYVNPFQVHNEIILDFLVWNKIIPVFIKVDFEFLLFF